MFINTVLQFRSIADVAKGRLLATCDKAFKKTFW